MEERVVELLGEVRGWVWGPPMLVLLVGTGIYLTVLLRGVQLRALGYSLWLALIKRKEDTPSEGDISHFQALMTALAATVGTGNIAGVATAITAGGPGALFWMWITGLFGMATKYSEAVLAVKFRVRDKLGTMSGGPMYYLSKGLGQRWLGVVFAIFASVAAFGIGNMVQSNSVADALEATFNVPFWATGLVLAVATALVILGGIKSIGRVTALLVPVMIVFYVGASLTIVALNYQRIPEIFQLVLKYAFTPTAAVGGFAGAAVMIAIREGVTRGVFSNESGLGSAPIAAAAAKTDEPVRQALVSMTQTFIDTLVVCSLTGFVIISSGLWNSGETGAELTTLAFSSSLPGNVGALVVTIGLILFAYSTILGWSYYGEKSIEYLLGERAVYPYRAFFCIAVGFGAVFKLQLVWSLADVMNGLMALPNLVGLLGLGGVIAWETRRYFRIYVNKVPPKY